MSLVWSHRLWGCMCVSNSFWIHWPISTKFSERVKISNRDVFLQVWGKQVAGEWMGEPLLVLCRRRRLAFIWTSEIHMAKRGWRRLSQMSGKWGFVSSACWRCLCHDARSIELWTMNHLMCCSVHFSCDGSCVQLGHQMSFVPASPWEEVCCRLPGCRMCHYQCQHPNLKTFFCLLCAAEELLLTWWCDNWLVVMSGPLELCSIVVRIQ